VSIFLASALIAIGCFVLAGIAAYFGLAAGLGARGTIARAYAVRHGGPGAK
jgi:hypothetical protein